MAPWDDGIISHFPSIIGIKKIDLRCGDIIDSIQVTYMCADKSLHLAEKHGGSGGDPTSITFGDHEYMVVVEGMIRSLFISQLSFITVHQDGTMNHMDHMEKKEMHRFLRKVSYLDFMAMHVIL